MNKIKNRSVKNKIFLSWNLIGFSKVQKIDVCKKGMENQLFWLVRCWSFANVLIFGGKNAAGKKNKFWGRKGLVFCGLFFDSVLLREILIFITVLVALHITNSKVFVKMEYEC